MSEFTDRITAAQEISVREIAEDGLATFTESLNVDHGEFKDEAHRQAQPAVNAIGDSDITLDPQQREWVESCVAATWSMGFELGVRLARNENE